MVERESQCLFILLGFVSVIQKESQKLGKLLRIVKTDFS